MRKRVSWTTPRFSLLRFGSQHGDQWVDSPSESDAPGFFSLADEFAWAISLLPVKAFSCLHLQAQGPADGKGVDAAV
jgi:hypothetical protein